MAQYKINCKRTVHENGSNQSKSKDFATIMAVNIKGYIDVQLSTHTVQNVLKNMVITAKNILSQ